MKGQKLESDLLLIIIQLFVYFTVQYFCMDLHKERLYWIPKSLEVTIRIP